MKNVLALTILIVSIITFGFKTTNFQQGTAPHIQFESVAYDFGTINQNDDGSYSFKFTNTGKEPLIIQNVQSSCGCTVASKPTEPILPGASAAISVKYDTRRIGVFQKNITVSSNADNATVVLMIKGDVKEKPAEEVPVKSVNQGFTPVAK